MSENLKQVIVVRKDLGMRKGKIAAQAGHAVMKTTFSAMNHVSPKPFKPGFINFYDNVRTSLFIGLTNLAFRIIGSDCKINSLSQLYVFSSHAYVGKWLSDIFTKICVSVNTERELQEIHVSIDNYNYMHGRKKGDPKYLACELIKDSGLTEFHGVPTLTCLAIGPAPAEIVDLFTGDLPLF